MLAHIQKKINNWWLQTMVIKANTQSTPSKPENFAKKKQLSAFFLAVLLQRK